MKGPHRQDGPLAPFVDGYRDWLLERGYTLASVIHALIALGHLGRWLQHEGRGVDQLDDDAVSRFVATQVRVRGRLPLASVRPLIEYLRWAGVVPAEPAGPQTAVDRLVDGYREWLLVERGLAPSTVRAREIVARRFLAGPLSTRDAIERCRSRRRM